MTNNRIKTLQKIQSKNVIFFTAAIAITVFLIHVFLITISTETSSISSEIQTPFHCKLASFIDYFCFTNLHDHYECIQSYSHKFVTVFRIELYRVTKFILKLPILLLSMSIDTFAFFGELLAYSLSELGDNCGKNMKLLREFADSIV